MMTNVRSAMARGRIKSLAVALFTGFIVMPLAHLRAQATDNSVNREALIAQVASHVKVMVFNSDKPVREIRVLMNGKEVASDKFQSTRSGLKLAVITPPHGKRDVEIYFEIDDMGGFEKCGFREIVEANVFQREYFGPGRNLVLKGWTQVYGLSQQYIGKTDALYDLQVEVK